MKAIRTILDRVTGTLCCLLLAAMIVIVVWQVISRYVLNDPSTFSEELLRDGVIWLSLIGAAYVAGKNKHMTVDLLSANLTGTPKKVLSVVIQLFFVLFGAGVLCGGGMKAVSLGAFQHSAVLQIPMSWIYAALPISGVLMVIYGLLNAIDVLRQSEPAAQSSSKPSGE